MITVQVNLYYCHTSSLSIGRLKSRGTNLLVQSHRLVSGDARMESQDSGANALTLDQLHSVCAQPLTYHTVPPQGTRDVVKARDSK